MTKKPTVDRASYRPLSAALNAGAGLLQGMGMSFGSLASTKILAEARQKTRLHDWGDEAFIPRMEYFLKLASESGDLTPLARTFVHHTAVKAVTNRLRIEKYVADRPEVLERPISRPVFILGFPRTGTTLLQNLMSLEGGRRALEFWELTTPVPVHDDPDRDVASRIAEVKSSLRLAYLINPEMEFVHEIGATTMEECWPLFTNTFAVLNLDLQSGLRAYGDRLLQTEMLAPYQAYRRQLQILSERCPDDDLVLKCPEHLWFVDALLEVFPDACIVWTHRDPLASVASYCSLISLAWRTFYGRFDPEVVGEHITHRFHQGVSRAMAAREKADPSRFFDVSFEKLVDDPVGMVRTIKQHFDLPHTEQSEGLMREWLATKRGDARGQHVYSADRYGLDPEDIYRRFDQYIRHFDIPTRGR